MAKQAKRGGATRTLKITLVKSPIGYEKKQALVVQGLGLRRLGHTVERPDVPETRGMIHKVRHLVSVSDASARVTSA